jgi:hypothetical protein
MRLTDRRPASRAARAIQPRRFRRHVILSAALLTGLSTAACAQPGHHADPAHSAADSTRTADSAFAAVQARGADPRAMGVDQYTSAHQFDALPDGGRIELQRAVEDPAGVAQIRRHLREIAAAFTAGDFQTPAFVHTQQVPGTAVMAAKRSAITYTARDLPRGGEVRITTHDPEALRAIHAFIAFQRQDHHAGGAGTPQHAHP